jgi:hypothetical protein
MSSKTTIQNQTTTTTQEINHQSSNSQFTAEIQNLLTSYKSLEIPNPLDTQFEEPKRYGDYTKFEEGNNSFRVLSDAIIGCEYWTEVFDQETGKVKNKPIRKPLTEASTLETADWSYFYAFFVWNYKAQKIQILNTSKRGIIKGLKTLINNQKWGDITQYDICITRRQTDPTDTKSVEYTVTPEPQAILDTEIAEKWENSNFNRDTLYMLFDGLDPFEIKRQFQEQEKKLKEQELTRNLRVRA